MHVLIKAHRDSGLELLGDIVHLGVQNPVKLALQGRHLLRGHGTHCSDAQSSDPRQPGTETNFMERTQKIKPLKM